MTTNQTIDGVPRELLLDIEYWLKHMEAENGVEGRCSALKELRALLDAPALQCSVPAIDTSMLGSKSAAQPKVQPVAYRCRHSAHEQWFFSDKPGYWEWQALYTEQTAPVAPTPINYGALDPVERLAVCRGEVAPVAVVLPKKRDTQPFTTINRGSDNYIAGWNAYANELKRLNPYL